MFFSKSKTEMVTADTALPGRDASIRTAETNIVTGQPLKGPFADGLETIYLAMGCFWGAERRFWQTKGVVATAVGYQGGFTNNPTYEEVCTAKTGHTEIVKVVYDPDVIILEELLKVFWEAHDPTQGMRQGNDIGTQYRSAIYTTTEEQMKTVTASKAAYQAALAQAGLGSITTEIAIAKTFYYAEDYHQQYLEKNPGGYCGLNGTGVACQTGSGVSVDQSEA